MDDKIKRVRELDANATHGPWIADGQSVTNEWEHAIASDVWEAGDLRLILEYRTLAPALADELEAARKERDREHHHHMLEFKARRELEAAQAEREQRAARAWRERNEAIAERDAERARAEKAEREREEFRMRLELSQESLTRVVHERNDLRARLADLERWREQAAPAIEAVRRLQRAKGGRDLRDVLDDVEALSLPDAPEVTK